jgi:hypothetical protein
MLTFYLTSYNMNENNSYLKKKNFLHMLIPLLVGFMLYLFFHKPNLLLHSYTARLIIIPNYYDSIIGGKFFIFLLNHLPDALWIYSLGIFLFLSFSFIKNIWLKAALIIILGSSTEVIQLFLSKQFTFDWIDLLINIVILTLISCKYEIKKNI